MASSDLSISGLASGVNTADIVDKLMSIERRPLIQMQNRNLALEKKQGAWKDLNTRLLTLSYKLNDLKLQGTFSSKKAVSGDDSVVTASAAAAASNASYTVQVKQLATADSVSSTQISGFDAAKTLTSQLPGFAPGKITVGGKVVDVTTSDTLNSLVDKINKAQSNVQASVINNRLVLSSGQTGTANALSVGLGGGDYAISDGDNDDNTANSNVLTSLGVYTGTTFNNYLLQAGDAEAYINGIQVTGSSNTIAQAVTGLTITLKAVSQSVGTSGNPVQDLKGTSLQVSVDTQKTVTAVKAFVDQYNSVMSFIQDKTGYDPQTKIAGDLFGESGILQIQLSLRQMVGSAVSGLDPKYNTLAQVGVSTTSKDPTLTFNESNLTDALTNNPGAVASLFGANRTDLALNSSGATATASSETLNYSAASVITGNSGYDTWGNNGGWQSDTTALSVASPAYLDIDFGAEKSLSEILLNTINSSAMPAGQYGIKDFDLQYWDGSLWNTIKSYTGNTQAIIDTVFSTVQTQKIRINVTAANGANDAARIVQVNAYEPNMGIAVRMGDLVKNLTDYGTGTIASRQKSLDSQIKDIKDQMTGLSDRLSLREETLRNQFNAMEQAIQSIKSQGISLTNMLNSLPEPLTSSSR